MGKKIGDNTRPVVVVQCNNHRCDLFEVKRHITLPRIEGANEVYAFPRLVCGACWGDEVQMDLQIIRTLVA